jgi:Ca-activated chloride channel family protein
MISLLHPWLLLLVALPPIIRMILPPYRESRQAVRVPWFHRMANLLRQEPAAGAAIANTNIKTLLFLWLLWVLIVVSLARPQFLESPANRIQPTRDLMLLVDLSGSMDTQDFTNAAGDSVNRLVAVKEVLDDFLTRRAGDRVGLIVFGNAAFVQIPFTQDLEAARVLLDETAVRMAGPRTALGDAIGLGITLFERSDVENRVMIALTDGNDTGSKVPPTQAARIAQDNDIIIHLIGVGDPAATGEEKLDEETLTDVATTTGGRYFHAADRDELEEIYLELDRIGAREIEAETYRPRTDLFHWPLAAFMLMGLMFFIVLYTNDRGEFGHG